jgi:glycosyltransferase involved in cell wall biosynthesis
MYKPMPKILLISYLFHPDLEVGAVRSVKFARYLPEFGWEPYVLTVDTRFIEQKDPKELDFDCPIFRTTKWPTPNDGYMWLKRKIGRTKPPVTDASNLPIDAEPQVKQSPFWKRFIDSLSLTPDSSIGWLIPATKKAISLIKQHKIDVIYTSGPPFTCHLVGLIAKKFTGRKLVCDYRDPWTTGNRVGDHFNAVSLAFERFLEKKSLSKANLILATTPAIIDQLIKTYHIEHEKAATIFNGYDEKDIKGRTKYSKTNNKPLTFLYAGTLYMGRDPLPIFQAISELLNDGQLAQNDMRLEFIGNIELGNARIRHVIAKLGLDDIVTIEGLISRDKYFDRIINADVLILIQSKGASPQIPGKTYEYLATGNPILALVPQGAASALMSEFDNVLIAEPGNMAQIKECILRLKNGLAYELRGKLKNEKLLNELTRRGQTMKLASILDKLADIV